jgi:uncharacterized protein (TIGR02231 family)
VTSGTLELNYLVHGAGWYPSYDVRVNSLSEPVSVTYKANVYQNSGIDWKNIKLTFSNAAPNLGGNVPWLNPWYLDFIRYSNLRNDMGVRKSAQPEMLQEMSLGAVGEVASAGFEISENLTSVEFKVEVPYTIPTGGEAKIIDMMYFELPSAFEYQTVPKLDQAAFLVARVHDWQNYDLLNGEANLYFDNTYVGRSTINPGMVSDTLNLSLGRDMGIVVKREKRKEFTIEKLIGLNKVVTRSWDLSVRNNKSETVKIHLTDQIPVSQNKDITVNAEELNGGKLNPVSGLVSWDFTLAPGETRKLVFTYSVKYPKDENVYVE